MIERCWLIGHDGWYGRAAGVNAMTASLRAAETLAIANMNERPKKHTLWANALTWSDIARCDWYTQYPYGCGLGTLWRTDDRFMRTGLVSRMYGYDIQDSDIVPDNVVVASYDARFMVFIDTMGAPC